jgi:hypothetical protein
MTTTPAMTPTAQRLYDLLPAVHRIRDAQAGGLLAELIAVIADQFDVLAADLDQMYDDEFIETCARWVAPYVGDLIGYRVLHGVVPQVASPRAEVANTIAYRRRKGTAAVLEQLALDVTGWPARAVEFFERLVTTQYLNHPRPHAQAFVDVRRHEALGWVGTQDGALDDLARTADVRRIAARPPHRTGRHNISNVGIFLWRTAAVPVRRSPLVEHADGRRFRFHPLGVDAPLFGLPRTEPDITSLAGPFDVPLPWGRRWLAAHLGACYGPRATLLLERQPAGGDPVPVPLADVRVCDLSDTSASTWAHEPPPGTVALDPVLGRVWLGTALAAGERVLATWAYGQAVPIGAGASTRVPQVPVPPVLDAATGTALPPLLTAVAAGGTVRITDNDAYREAGLTLPATGAGAVQLTAGDQAQPTLHLTGPLRLDLAADAVVVLDGLRIAGAPLVLEEVGDTRPRTLILRNCTLVPGLRRSPEDLPVHPDRASLLVLDPFARVELERCILGPVVAVEGSRVALTDCAVDAGGAAAVAVCGRPAVPGGLRGVAADADTVVGDGTAPAGDVALAACTVVGGITATRLDASNSILLAVLPAGDPRRAAVLARRRQVGCVRYSWVPPGSRVARRYRCQPADGAGPPVRPRFTSLAFAHPAYLQLSAGTAQAIRTGAQDESELGATHLLHTPQREANLLLRCEEYLRFGLQAGYGYAT